MDLNGLLNAVYDPVNRAIRVSDVGVTSSARLLESGSYRLLEDGSKRLLET